MARGESSRSAERAPLRFSRRSTSAERSRPRWPAHSQASFTAISPANVFLVRGSTADAGVVDFGIALKKDGHTLTGTGEMLGTGVHVT
jgi:hypothetical protein